MNKEITNNQEFLEFRKKFGQNLQKLRKLKGMSQEELASKAGLDRVSIGYLEQGIRSPKLKTIFLISKILDIPIKIIFDI